MTERELTCFKGTPLGLSHHHDGQTKFGSRQLRELVQKGDVACPVCQARVNLHQNMRDWHVFGNAEALFGLDVWRGSKPIPATAQHNFVFWDVAADLPYDGNVVYANITMNCADVDEAPSLALYNQSPHQPWPTFLRFCVPPGGPKRAISLAIVLKRTDVEYPSPIEFALEALDAFHRYKFGLACVLLAASVEAALRPLVEATYSSRTVRIPQDLAFAALLERSQLLYVPALGAKLVGSLRDLAKNGRNATAHGKSATVSMDQVAAWMVDVATIYEWSLLATPA